MAEFNMQAVWRKTEKGLLAIKSRDSALSVRSRTVLIIVSGDKTAEALQKLVPQPQETPAILQQLLEQGFIEEVPGTPVEAPPAMAPSTIPAPPTAAGGDLRASVQRASRLLYDLLGPSADRLCVKLEGVKTREEYLSTLQECRAIVASVRSEARAQAFYEAATA